MAPRLYGVFNSGVAVGSAGAAVANQSTPTIVKGTIVGVYVEYKDSCPSTTDVVIKTVGTSPNAPSYNILSLTNNNTSGWYRPVVQNHDVSGSPITGQYQKIPVHDNVNVAIAQADADCNVNVWILLDENG